MSQLRTKINPSGSLRACSPLFSGNWNIYLRGKFLADLHVWVGKLIANSVFVSCELLKIMKLLELLTATRFNPNRLNPGSMWL